MGLGITLNHPLHHIEPAGLLLVRCKPLDNRVSHYTRTPFLIYVCLLLVS